MTRTFPPNLPPAARSNAAHHLTAAAARGAFALPCCTGCGRFLWPFPEACPDCLSDVAPTLAPRGARLISATTAEVPAHPYFRARAPWRVGLVTMDCGPQALVHLHPDAQPERPVTLTLMLDRAGQAVLHAAPEGADMATDPQWQEMVADPRGRRVLITDARHSAALPLAQALAQAGAAAIYLGLPDPQAPVQGRAAFLAVPEARLVALDVTSDASVADLGRELASDVDIVVNTADLARPGGLLGPTADADAQAMAEVTTRGLMRLARAFGPGLAARGADGPGGAVAWVNLLSVHAHAPPPDWAVHAATQSAALALLHALRAELAPGGVRLMIVTTGPTTEAGFHQADPPKVTGKALADAVLTGLLQGLEEVVVGDVARDLMARLAANPTAVARGFWAQRGLG